MSRSPTKDQQVKHVVEGLALGALAHGVEAVTSNKQAIEFGCNYAWRRWDKAHAFPSIPSVMPDELLWGGIWASERRVGVSAAWGRSEDHKWLIPYLMAEHWTVEECLRDHADERAASHDWYALAGLMIEYLKPEEVWR